MTTEKKASTGPRGKRGDTREKVFQYMRSRILSGRSPTVREVRDALGVKATQTVQFHLEKLLSSGRLVQEMVDERGRSRGYTLPDRMGLGRQRLVPLLGHVQAGELTTAFEDPEGYVSVQSNRTEDELFGLRVSGESMKDAGILPDDLVVVRRQQTAQDGDIVVALVADEATVKTFRQRGKQVELHPANEAFSPIIPAMNELIILGKVIEVRRFL